MKVICISGHAQSGKDFSADMIRLGLWGYGKRVLITHYADLLKFVCEKFLNWDGKKNDEGRRLLQYVGTDIIRAENPDYWVNFIIDMLKFFPTQWDYVIIPDCRFPNEIEKMRKAGFDVTHIRIEREGFDNGLSDEQKNHSSETALDGMSADIVVRNDGTIVDLCRTLHNIVAKWED